ncbi:MAG: hydantoinase/oxoprolinase family protein, partial [Dehalococcoidales bacterium]
TGVHIPPRPKLDQGPTRGWQVLERPVETILSGPAASAIGARYLSDLEDVFVIDMGGTTTDIAALRNGAPALKEEGARVGGFRTMVEAVDVHTTGLGGDSEVRLDKSGRMSIGPNRVIPLCYLAQEHPMVIDTLRIQMSEDTNNNAGRFIMRERSLGADGSSITSSQRRIWEQLGDGPASLKWLFDSLKSLVTLRMDIEHLTGRGLVVGSGFTPTDAVHVLGQHRVGSLEAAELGAEVWARRLDISRDDFCRRVVQQVVVQAGRALIKSALVEEGGFPESGWSGLGRLFVDQALGAGDLETISVALSLRRPVIGIGAPAATYLSILAEKLRTRLYVPEHAEVANAIGAVASGVVQTVHALIKHLGENKFYRVYLPFGARDFQSLDEAVSYARRTVSRLARNRAHRAGSGVVGVHIAQHDRTARVYGTRQHIETEVIATATGRPRIKEA